jgi:hypothetical protein
MLMLTTKIFNEIDNIKESKYYVTDKSCLVKFITENVIIILRWVTIKFRIFTITLISPPIKPITPI